MDAFQEAYKCGLIHKDYVCNGQDYLHGSRILSVNPALLYTVFLKDLRTEITNY